MNLSEISDLDLKKLPTEVVKTMYHVCLRELQSRRESTKIDQRRLTAFSHDVLKVSGLKNPGHEYNRHHLSYLKDLIDQDWSSLFCGNDDQKYYVYLHITPSGKRINFEHGGVMIKTAGQPFYVGKGTGQRAYDMNRNQGHGAILRQLVESGHGPNDIAFIVQENITEAAALELESKLIYFFGTRYERGRKGLLVNLDIPSRPEFY